MSRRVLITGASKGIGLEVARRLAGIDWQVIGLARSTPPTFPGQFVTCDITDEPQLRTSLTDILADGHVDALVNNAGTASAQTLGEVTSAELNRVLAVNLIAPTLLAQILSEGMRTAHWGRIINLSSVVALGAPARTSYAAAKAALVSATRVWALELATAGITVNAVSPGPTDTDLFRTFNPPGGDGDRRYRAEIPMARIGSTNEIASVIQYLLSEDAGFITGQVLYVDGGWTVGRAKQ
jgi:3-oxoacyl-[acyl-carrier protein] reductase